MTNTSSVAAPSSLASASPGFSIVVKDPQYPQPSSVVKGVYPWDAVYAPNREHDLTFVSGKSLKGNGGSITWTVSMQTTGDDGALSYETVRSWKANGASSPSQVLATQAGKQHRITAVDEAGNTATATYIAKHIRREVRSLSEDDRDIFLTALATVMATPTEAGRALYGDDFFGGEWFLRWHMTSRTAGPDGKIKSPWHGNPSFLTAHVAFSDVFERSLQEVNPKAAAHFYDYTIDGENLEDWTTSEIWTDKFFGAGNASSKYEVGGRWKDVRHSVVTDMDVGVDRLHNSYGIETMPYNNNPSMAVSRSQSWCGLSTSHFKMPACTELITSLSNSSKNDIFGFYFTSNGLLHGELHNLMGGMWSCAYDLQDLVEAHPNLTSTMMHYVKDFDMIISTNYYDEKVTCPTSCDVGVTSYDDCTCSCPDYPDMDEEVSPEVWMERFSVLVGAQATAEWTPQIFSQLTLHADGTYRYSDLSYDDNAKASEMQTKLLCSSPKMSDFGTPYASPFDPIFFPVHVSSERYWTYTRLVNDDPEFVAFDKGWAAASLDSSPDDDGFTGYNFYDPMKPFDNAYGNVREPNGTYYTNQEIMELYNPLKDELPYIFEDLSWTHCGGGI